MKALHQITFDYLDESYGPGLLGELMHNRLTVRNDIMERFGLKGKGGRREANKRLMTVESHLAQYHPLLGTI